MVYFENVITANHYNTYDKCLNDFNDRAAVGLLISFIE